ncbi:MAG: hypothetical protein EPO01_21015 [Aquabacterium sp.]|nr:MAG: hypothetical protein EPO01_21015 [Aquabacterium sp.]
MSTPLRFRYPLQPLLTKRRWDLDALRAELAAARGHLTAEEQALARLRDRAAAVCGELAGLRAAGRTLDPARDAVLRRYADSLDDEQRQQEERLHRARQLHEAAKAEAARALQALRGIERHRETQVQAHRAEGQREQIRQADDDWLMRHPSQEAGT